MPRLSGSGGSSGGGSSDTTVTTVADMGSAYSWTVTSDEHLLVGTMTQNCTLTVGGYTAGAYPTMVVYATGGDWTLTFPGGSTTTVTSGGSKKFSGVYDGVSLTFVEVGGAMTNPMTASGDIIVGGSSGAAQVLAKSTDGYFLTLTSGTPSWVALPAAATGTYQEVLTAESTSATTANGTDLATVGPAVTITGLTSHDAIRVNATVEIKGDGTNAAQAWITDGTTPMQIATRTSATYNEFQTSASGIAGTDVGAATTKLLGGDLVIPYHRLTVVGGSVTLTMKYRTAAGGPAFFQNRRLRATRVPYS